jgi:hypothetical protein
MRFVVIQGVVLNTEAIDMIVPQGQQSQVTLRGGKEYTFALTTEEILEHLRVDSDQVVRVVHDASKESEPSSETPTPEESA